MKIILNVNKVFLSKLWYQHQEGNKVYNHRMLHKIDRQPYRDYFLLLFANVTMVERFLPYVESSQFNKRNLNLVNHNNHQNGLTIKGE